MWHLHLRRLTRSGLVAGAVLLISPTADGLRGEQAGAASVALVVSVDV